MSRAGRKRKQAQREPNGQIQRSPVSQERLDDAARAYVRAQPHRLGSADQRCATEFGRFCLRSQLRRELYDAGEEYGEVVFRWRKAKGIPTGWSNRRGGSGRDPSEDQILQWGRRIMRMEGAMMDASQNGYHALRGLVLDGYGLGMDQDGPVVTALQALAVELEMIDPKAHPFNGGR